MIATIFYRNPTGGYSASLSSGEFSLQVPGCKLEVFKHGYGRKLEVETLSITGNSDYKNKIKPLEKKTTAL